jgi:hypothetical protein
VICAGVVSALAACGGGSGEADAGTSACGGMNQQLAASWRTDSPSSVGLPLTIRFSPIGADGGTVHGMGRALGLADVPLPYSIATTCDAVLITDLAGNLLRTFRAEFRNEWLHLGSGWSGKDRYYWREGSKPVYPAELYVKYLTSFDPIQWRAATGDSFLTGYGAIAGMAALPGSTDFKGLTLQEEVVPVPGSDSCSALAGRPDGFLCTNDGMPAQDTFTFEDELIGAPQGFGQPETNVFWDVHRFPSSTISLLHHAGRPSCSAQCVQRYRLGNLTIGSFLITYTLTRDDTHNVTAVRADKTPTQ